MITFDFVPVSGLQSNMVVNYRDGSLKPAVDVLFTIQYGSQLSLSGRLLQSFPCGLQSNMVVNYHYQNYFDNRRELTFTIQYGSQLSSTQKRSIGRSSRFTIQYGSQLSVSPKRRLPFSLVYNPIW